MNPQTICRIILATIPLLSGWSLRTGGIPPRTPNQCIAELLKDCIAVVETRVVGTKREGDHVRATLEVKTVFLGNVKPGIQFDLRYFIEEPGAFSLMPYPIEFMYPPPSIGEEQLGMLVRRRDGRLSFGHGKCFGLWLPVRNGKAKCWRDYRGYVQAARMVSRLARVGPEKQLQILTQNIDSKFPQVARCAVWFLEQWRSAACKKALWEIRNHISSLPIPNQTYLDEALCKLFTEDWIGSNERRRLLESWIIPRILNDDEENTPVVLRLLGAFHAGQLDSDQLLDFTIRIEKNPEIKPKVRREMLFDVANTCDRWGKKDQDGFFFLLTELIQAKTDPLVRTGAAYVLRNCKWLHSPENLRIIHGIRQHVSDKKLASILDTVLQSHERGKASNPSSKEGPATNQGNK